VVLFIALVIKATVDKYLAAKRRVINWCSVDFELPFISTDKKALFFKIQRIIHRDIQLCARCGENQVPRCAPKKRGTTGMWVDSVFISCFNKCYFRIYLCRQGCIPW
jgi:hypothetical protein